VKTLLPLALLLTALPARAGTPEQPGPYSAVSETDTIQAGPSSIAATVCYPEHLDGAHPVIALATSSVESKDVLGGVCLQLASYGFIAAVPDLGFANTDAVSIGQTLLDTLAFLTREGGRSGSRFFGRVDPLHRGVLGFSTGAMGALSAAGADSTLSAAILLDPQDVNGLARSLAPQVTVVPVLMVRGDPSLCNGQDNFGLVYAALTGPRSTLHVYDSVACDAEQPATTQCQATCGIVRPYAADRFLRYATAYAQYFVACNASYRSYLDGAGLRSDVEDLSVDHHDAQDLPATCGPYGVVDAGPAEPDAGPAVAPGGCGCGPRGPSGAGWALALALAALPWLRRRA